MRLNGARVALGIMANVSCAKFSAVASSSIFDSNAAYQAAVQQMSSYYARWASEHLARDEDNGRAVLFPRVLYGTRFASTGSDGFNELSQTTTGIGQIWGMPWSSF